MIRMADGEMALLEAAVGAKKGTPKFSSYITEPTYLLINTINKVGNFATHYHDHVQKTLHVDKTPLIDKAYSACQIMVAIELYESLYRDLKR